MNSPITIEKLQRNSLNSIFFKNASFHGDNKYEINEREMTLTVHMKVDGKARKAIYKINDAGTIGTCIAH